MVLWIGAVLVSVLPVALDDHVDMSFGISRTLKSVNKAVIFKYLFFVVIPLAVLSLSTIIDYLARTKHWTVTGKALTILTVLFGVLSIGGGLVGFLRIPRLAPLPDGQLWGYS